RVLRRGRRAPVDRGRLAGVRTDAAARRRTGADRGPGARDELRPPDRSAARVRHGFPRRAWLGARDVGGARRAVGRRDRVGRRARHLVPRAPGARPRRDRADPADVRYRAGARCPYRPPTGRAHRRGVTIAARRATLDHLPVIAAMMAEAYSAGASSQTKWPASTITTRLVGSRSSRNS